jgi:hypothetical protein
MTETLQPGLTGTASVTVTADLTAAALGSGNVDVYSTPALIALLEAAAISALAGHLADGQTSVGTALDVRHLAATPVGMNVILSQGIRLGKLTPWLAAMHFGHTYHRLVEDNEAAIAHNAVQHLIDHAAFLLPEAVQRQVGEFFESGLLDRCSSLIGKRLSLQTAQSILHVLELYP